MSFSCFLIRNQSLLRVLIVIIEEIRDLNKLLAGIARDRPMG